MMEWGLCGSLVRACFCVVMIFLGKKRGVGSGGRGLGGGEVF